MKSSIDKATLIATLKNKFGAFAKRKDILTFVKEQNMPIPNWLINGAEYKSDTRGIINLGTTVMAKKETPEPVINAQVLQIEPLRQKKLISEVGNLVPEKDANYVPFGFYRDLDSIISSKVFYPVFITGLTGNGKTTMVEQVCAKQKRECIRVNVSIETDEDDLIGGRTLIDGNITFQEGPVLLAMRRGAVLLIDEIDRGSNKLMCIQGILEGKPFFNKKTGDVIHPAPGFTVIATANTKGQGSDSGKYIAAQILDEAFLERFPITVEQEYPSNKIERKIVINNMNTYNCVNEEFADKLVKWAEVIRKTYMEEAIDEMISTRRLVHIVRAFSMFKDQKKAIELCISRFDADTKSAFLDLYKKLEEPTDTAQPTEEPVKVDDDKEIEF